MTALAERPAPVDSPVETRRVAHIAVLVAVVSLGGLAAGRWPGLVAGACLGSGLVLLVAIRPQMAAMFYLALGPLVIGLERGTLLPLVRVNEILLGALWLGLLAGPVRGWIRRGCPRPRLDAVDGSVFCLAVFSSVTGLLWMYARGEPIAVDDMLFALTLWKYFALYVLVRISLRTAEEVRAALLVILASSAVVAVLGVLQVLQVGSVQQLLSSFVSADEQERVLQLNAKSTIGSSIAFANVMAVLAAIGVSWVVLARSYRATMVIASAFFSFAALASAQVSGVLGLTTVMVIIGFLLHIGRRLLALLVPLVCVAGALLWPAVQARLSSLDPQTGLPVQWTGSNGRIANLQTFFWPRLAEGWNWFFGVRTSARVEAPESWREWVWIESGYTWLLWNGGVPLLIVFVCYICFGVRACQASMRPGVPPAFRVAAAAALTGLGQVAVLMLLDTHLTIRGAADLLFPLVAMAVTGSHVARLGGEQVGTGRRPLQHEWGDGRPPA